jgi:hypothetical protein
MLESLIGGLFGGAMRLAPEILKLLDRKNERDHELRMQEQEMEFAKLRAQETMHQADANLSVAEFGAISDAFKEQSVTASNAGWFVSAISALVRPTITYLFALIYCAVKIAAYLIAVSQGSEWTVVITQLWKPEDMTVLNMILTFWFVGRVYERNSK